MSIKNDIEAAADQMGLDAGDLAEKLCGDISQMQSHEGRHEHGGGYAAAVMMRDELGLDAPLADILSGVVAFIDAHGDLDSMTREAQAQIAQDLGDDSGLTFNERAADKARASHPSMSIDDASEAGSEVAEVEAQAIRSGDVILDDGVLMEPAATDDARLQADGSAVVPVEGRELRFPDKEQAVRVRR